MGIPGIYKELGPGERISLAKLSVEHLETTERRFRLAVDISIWQFQIQSGEGGRNPALRTLYYRLLKFLGLGICPLFVFDGPYKPKLKRNVKSSINTACLDNYLTKQLLTKFKFPFHDAPGEAEAECALLQKKGIVDAVLSEDVDTLMFGCTLSLRSWTSEGTRSGKSPTHVNMYTTKAIKRKSGLDSYGMILVALMSGGDYNTKALQGCGPKIACEAARAGFGHDMCQLAENDHLGWKEWRRRLQHELHTNESKFFKQKNKSINLPEEFPDQTVLNYYIRPVVSSLEQIERLKTSIKWDMDIDIANLRTFVAEAFNWTYLIGAKLFIRTFAPALLAHRLLERSTSTNTDDNDDLEAKESAESQLIAAIHSKRAHWNTDGCSELRVSYMPSKVALLDLSLEEDFDQLDNPILSHEEAATGSDNDENNNIGSPSKLRGPSTYDPNHPEKIWILETFIRLGTPLLLESWEADLRDPKRFASRKARERAALSNQKYPSKGAMDRFVKVTKPITGQRKLDTSKIAKGSSVIPSSTSLTIASSIEVVNGNRRGKSTTVDKAQGFASKKAISGKIATSTSADAKEVNPWTLSKRPPDTYGFRSTTRYSALGIYASDDAENSEPRLRGAIRSSQVFPIEQSRALPIDQAVETLGAKHSREASTASESSSGERIQRLEHVTFRTPRRLETSKPSPRKKRTPVKTGGEDNSKLQPGKSSAVPEGAELINLDSQGEEVTEQRAITLKVNRKLNFMKSIKMPQDGSLYSPTTVIGRKHVFVSLRESLEGAWKRIEPWQADDAANVFTDVEVLDLTSN